MILIIDNYDSFTYNLVHLVAQNLDRIDRGDGKKLIVRRNDKILLREIRDLSPEGILISPGPGRGDSAGISRAIVDDLSDMIPILGVCLGHQIIGEAFGATVTYAPILMHGKTSEIQHDGRSIFRSVPSGFIATRYHSLVVEPESVPDTLEVSATTSDGVVMGLRHRILPVEGIQFHPESILTVEGPKLIANWVNSCLRDVNSVNTSRSPEKQPNT